MGYDVRGGVSDDKTLVEYEKTGGWELPDWLKNLPKPGYSGDPTAGGYTPGGIVSSYQPYITPRGGANATAKVDPSRAKMFEQRQSEFDIYFRPEYEAYGALQERQTRDVMEREKAKALQQLGYARSAGSGASGVYDAASIAMNRGFGQKSMELSQIAEQGVLQAYVGYVMQGDSYDHQKQMAELGYQYNMQMAQMNQPGWWDAIGAGISILPFL